MTTSLTELTPDRQDSLAVKPGVFNVKHDEDENYRGTVVKVTDASHILVGNHEYTLVQNYHDGFDPERLGQRFESILNKYNYIVGDWGFEQLRLRGFYDDRNHSANRDQTISTLQDYLFEFCNFGCAFFVLESHEQNVVRTSNRRHNSQRGNSGTSKKTAKSTQQTTVASQDNRPHPKSNQNRKPDNSSRRQGDAAHSNHRSLAPVAKAENQHGSQNMVVKPTGRTDQNKRHTGRQAAPSRETRDTTSRRQDQHQSHTKKPVNSREKTAGVHSRQNVKPKSSVKTQAASPKSGTTSSTAPKKKPMPRSHEFHIRKLEP